MEALHDNRLNTDSGEADYENVLKDYKITVDKKYLDDIVKAGAFYINTQRTDNDVRDQHAIYLSVLKIIESEGSVDKAVKKFQSIVEQGKKDKKAEKKEGYESGEKL
jgi:ribosomal protein S21